MLRDTGSTLSPFHAFMFLQGLEDQGIKSNTIRISVGIEHINDLIEALENAFKTIEKKYEL